MNEFSQTEHSFDPQVFDRLVDGELADGERREMLAALDRLPDGWRQCALAFLEAQTWGQTLTEFVRQPADAAAPAGAAGTAVALRPDGPDGDGNVLAGSDEPADGEAARHGRWRTLIAIAGSFLVTFSLGMYAQRYLHPSSSAGEASALTGLSPSIPPGSSAQPPASVAGGFQTQFVDILLTSPDGHQQRVRAPLVDRELAQLFVPNQGVMVPDNLRSAIERSGNQL